jgi:hypothetical protein
MGNAVSRFDLNSNELALGEIAPGHEGSAIVAIDSATGGGLITASITEGGPVFQVKRITAFHAVLRTVDRNELPPGFKPGPKGLPKVKVIEPVATSDGRVPLTIVVGQRVEVEITFSCPAQETGKDTFTGTLSIQLGSHDPQLVPISMTRAQTIASFDTQTIGIAQGVSGDVGITVHRVAGPDTDVRLSLHEGPESHGVSMPITSIHVSRGETRHASLTLSVAAAADLGPRNLDFFTSFANTLTVIVSPGACSVALVSTGEVTVVQGQTLQLLVRVALKDPQDNTQVDFAAVTLPQNTVMASQTVEMVGAFRIGGLDPNLDPDGSRTISLMVSIGADAPANPLPDPTVPLVISYSAFNGAQTGKLMIALRILPASIESIDVRAPVVTPEGFPLGGWVQFTLRSDGSYAFSGAMRATGLPSYHFGLQAYVNCADGVVIAGQETGHAYGTDTPGDREHAWSNPGTSSGIKDHWRSIRSNARIGYRLDADIGGVLGVGWDIAKLVVEALAAAVLLPGIGVIIFVGPQLGAAVGIRVATPDNLAGFAVAAGMIFVLGPGMMVPSIVAGVAVATLLDIKHRSMTDEERQFASKVFLDRIPFDRVTLTNLSHGGGRKYTIPSIDGSILVNLNDAYDDPVHYVDATPGSDYSQPGAVFIHELTHAWQIANTSFVPGLICDMSNNYSYHVGTTEDGRLVDRSWALLPWTGFNLEQQAHIVDDWYGKWYQDLNGFGATNDPAFHFIQDNIRAGSD